MTEIVLVHSPVTGPSTWRWVADLLVARGHAVRVPVVPAVATWEDFVSSAAAQAGNPDVLVGHSGAGPVLPQIQSRARAEALVFVDADIPPESGEAALMPAEYLTDLRTLAVDGMLPPWSQWFGPDAMRELVPDDDRRAIVTAELPRVPLSYFTARVPVPTGWGPSGYVLLSEAYAAQADRAAANGWPVVRQPGAHLDTVTRPEVVAEAILSVLAGQEC